MELQAIMQHLVEGMIYIYATTVTLQIVVILTLATHTNAQMELLMEQVKLRTTLQDLTILW